MIYCPECGSQVAPDDVFCPYCGISIAVNPANVSAEPLSPEVEPAVAIESLPIETPKIETPEAVSPSPFVLDKEPEPPAEIEPELPPLPESPVFFENLTPSEAKVEIIESPAEMLAESKPEDSPGIPANELPAEIIVPSLALNTEDQEQVETKEKVEIPFVEVEETPIETEVKTESEPISEDFEKLPSEIIKTPAPINEVDEFSSTIPNIPTDSPQNELNLGEFSLNQPIETVSEVAETPIISTPAIETAMVEEIVAEEKVEAEDDILPIVAKTPIEEKIEAAEEILLIEEESPIAEKVEAVEENIPPVLEAANLAESEVISIPEVEETPIQQFVAVEESAPIVEEAEKVESSQGLTPPIPLIFTAEPKAKEQVSAVEDDSQQARAFTNPNIGVGVDTDGRNKVKLKPLDEGTILNKRYEIERKIGGGGMGAVYLAKDNNLGGVKRAVKEMVQSYIEEEQQDKAISDFKRESELLTALDHPAIPTIFDYFFDEKEGRFYLVMKYISGGDLAGRLRAAPEGRLDEVTVTDWAIQVADVLSYLHQHDPPIIYRDLKPSNIMIDGNTGKVMLIDFGIARTVHKEEKGVTAVGTMGYAPPELFSGNVEPGSDIYSLGSTMFHLLTGADPQSNPLLIFDFNKHPRPRQINPQLSDQIEQVLMRAVEYNSAQRFVTAGEMRDGLTKHMENLRKGAVTFGVVAPNSGMQSASSISVFCGFCGQKIVATDMFCPFCGAQQPLAAQSQNLSAPPVISSQKLTARLLIVGTNDLEQTEYSLEKDNNLLGRRDPMSNIFPEVDLSKYDPQTKISRKHARIWRENEMFMLEDLGSSNGTILTKATNESNRLLPRQPQVLTSGDKIRVGDTTLRFTIG